MNEPDGRRELEYSTRPTDADRRRLTRLVFGLLAAKAALVALNTLLAFEALGPTPTWARLAGIGAQVALTLVFLVVLLRLATRPGR